MCYLFYPLGTQWVRVPVGYGMGKDSCPWVRVWVKFYTHRLYGYGYGIALPCPYCTHATLSC